ncbi:hypothetical protein [Vibrio sinaloensis]|uniref:hypothetical protein n=1 Tax=Photobacterium sp. (strain ATCC 43367) TaxID=379097 RepID=UPI0022B07B90|nr:hypothetical protein [Vibrio sinaloensis]MCZ4292417.1 hypothetical protein [Vibrio sinaloensis]
MNVRILLVSGSCPCYFGGFGISQSGKPFVIATAQAFNAKHYSVTNANSVLALLTPTFPLAQLSYATGA